MKKRKIYFSALLIIISAVLLFYPFANILHRKLAFHDFRELAGIVVVKEPYRHYRYFITEKRVLRQIGKNLIIMEKVEGKQISSTYRLTFVLSDGTGREFSYLPNVYLCDLSTGEVFRPSRKLQLILNRELLKLKNQVNKNYGQLIPWSEVKELFPLNAFATIIDLDTGLRFLVQRRAGSNHADVQPLSAEDTAIMKKIYHGKWSWDRRAVIVEVNGLRIAASMNGMPHGSGAIRHNNFPGHFCVHFWGSSLHKAKRVDKAHQRMVLKAAGML